MRLENVCTVFTDGDWIESKDQSESGIRLIQTGNIGEGQYLEKETHAKYISKETFDKLKCTEIFPGDILVSRLPEPVGRACIIPQKNERMITAVDCTICRPNEEIVNKEYLCYFMRSSTYYNRLLGNVTGTTRKRISRKNLGNVELDVPSLSEQSAVVEKLNCVVNIIFARKQELQKFDDLIKARFVEMFGDPVLNNKGWDIKKLDEVCDGIGDGLHGTPEYSIDGEYPFINGNNLMDGVIEITPATKMVDANTYKKYYIAISPNAMLISINGTLGKLAFYNGEEVMLGKSACYCNLKPEINREFVYGVMKTDSFARFLEEKSTQSTIKNVGLKAMREFKLIIPPQDLQEQYVTFCEHVDKSKVAVQKALDETQLLFDSLMQEYFG